MKFKLLKQTFFDIFVDFQLINTKIEELACAQDEIIPKHILGKL